MAQSPPFSDVVLDLNRQHSADETVYSQAANAAITEMSVKLCSGMDSMSVALKLHTKHLLSGNTLEAVRDFQEVTEAKNSRILESVKNAITVVGLQGFMDFLSILGEVHLLRSVVTDLKESYQKHLRDIQYHYQQTRLFWEQQRAQLGSPPVPSITHLSSISQQSPPLPHSVPTVPIIGDNPRHYPACLPLSTDSSYPVTAHTSFHRLQPMSTNLPCHDEHVTNGMQQHEQSKLLSLMPPIPSSGAHHLRNQLSAPSRSNVVSNPWPSHSNSAPLCLNTGPFLLGPRGTPYSAVEASSNWWSMEQSSMALDNQQPMPSQSTPPLMQSENGSHQSALSGLTHEQSASSPSPLSTSTNQPARQHVALQQDTWLQSGSDRHSPPDSGLFSLQSSSSIAGQSDSSVEQFSRGSEGLSHSPQQLAIPTQMWEVLPSGSSNSAGGSSSEIQGDSRKFHRQKSFDEDSVSKQGSHADSMDSGITGSQASLDNEDVAT